jgi:hypothetical protein
MTPEKKRTTAKALSLLVIMGGSIVVALLLGTGLLCL